MTGFERAEQPSVRVHRLLVLGVPGMVVERIRDIVHARAVLPNAPKRFVKQFMLSIKVAPSTCTAWQGRLIRLVRSLFMSLLRSEQTCW